MRLGRLLWSAAGQVSATWTQEKANPREHFENRSPCRPCQGKDPSAPEVLLSSQHAADALRVGCNASFGECSVAVSCCYDQILGLS